MQKSPEYGAKGWRLVLPTWHSVSHCYWCSLSTFGHFWAFLPVKGFSVTIPTLAGGINHTRALNHPYHNVSLGNWWRFEHIYQPLLQRYKRKRGKITFWHISKNSVTRVVWAGGIGALVRFPHIDREFVFGNRHSKTSTPKTVLKKIENHRALVSIHPSKVFWTFKLVSSKNVPD